MKKARFFGIASVLGWILFLTLSAQPFAGAEESMGAGAASDSARIERIDVLQGALDRNPSDCEALKALGILFHELARKDAEKYAPKALELFTRAREIDRRDPESLCYLGSTCTLMALTTWNPIKKMSYVNKGIAYMDKAVKQAPENIAVRMTRGSNSKSLPAFFHRRPSAVEDYEYLAARIEKDPDRYHGLKKTVYESLSELYSKEDRKDLAEKYRQLANAL